MTRSQLIRHLMIRTGAIAAATSLLAVSAHADSPAARAERAMDDCVAAFVAAKLPKEQPLRIEKQGYVASPLDAQQRAYKIVVTATGAHSGKRLARSTCLVDRNGTLIAINGKRVREQLAQADDSLSEKTAAR